MAEKILSIQDIYDKVFKTSFRGYDSVEVDHFLDSIINDYETYEEELKALRAENARLLQQLKNNVTTTQEPAPIPQGTTNYDILKRLSNLEKHVFGAKLNNQQ